MQVEGQKSEEVKNAPPPADAVDKKADSQDGSDGKADDAQDSADKWTPETKAYIEKLRKESAGYRTKLKDAEGKLGKTSQALKKLVGADSDKELSAEELESKVGELQTELAKKEFQSATFAQALEHGIAIEDVPYFQYLIEKKAEEIAEGEELPEDDYKAIIAEVKSRSKVKKSAASTSVEADKSKDPDKDLGVTLEEFTAMTITEKSLLYEKTPAVYNKLFAQAKQKKLLT